MLLHDFPPRAAGYQQFWRWNDAGCFAAIVKDMRRIIRTTQGHENQPSAMVFDGRTLQSTCEHGARGGYDSTKSSKVHMAVDTTAHSSYSESKNIHKVIKYEVK